ncbi:MAG: NUDIX domain-containing protein [Verrucomicrobia bacterium]|nr:NUDIX domain-containing protein [Verrucomicrobiota bacterium]
MIRNVIFDWSGTLVDDLPAVWQASNFVFRQAGVPEMTLEEFRAEFCLPFTKFYDRYTPHVPMAQLEAWFHGRFRECQDSVAALPHAREFLEFCRRCRLRTFLLSSVHEDHFARQTAATGFQDFLDHPYVGVWDKRTKIREILEQHGLRPEETLFVGDMQHDIETARHGGVLSCAVLTGYNRLDQLRASAPDVIVEHLGELRALLEQRGLELLAAVSPPAMPVATVGALIFRPDGDDILMVRTHKWSHLWGIPGGKIKFGETSVDALRREIKEETDLDIGDLRFVLVQDCIHSTEFYRDAHFVLLNYTCRAVGPAHVRLNEEAQEFEWVPLRDALALPLNQPTRVLIDAVLK